MSMEHRRAVMTRNRVPLRQRLELILEGAPQELSMSIARAATLSGPEAKRMLTMAANQNDDISNAQLDEARKLIEQHSVAP